MIRCLRWAYGLAVFFVQTFYANISTGGGVVPQIRAQTRKRKVVDSWFTTLVKDFPITWQRFYPSWLSNPLIDAGLIKLRVGERASVEKFLERGASLTKKV